MSKKQKRLDRFTGIPQPTDYHWDELVTLLNGLGFDFDGDTGSSHGKFVYRNDKSRVINTSRPHPSGILKSYQIKEIKARLVEWGLIKL